MAYEFLEGTSLADKLANGNFSPEERANVIAQFKEIAKSLAQANVIHRDIHSGNFMISHDGKLKLIDFEWCVDSEHYEECAFIKRNPLMILSRAGDFSRWCYWDDVYSLLKVLEEIGCQSEYQDTFREVESFLKERLGKKVVIHKHRHWLLFPGLFRKLGTFVGSYVKRLRKYV